MTTPKGFWKEGRFIKGATVKTSGTFSTSGLELEVAAAVARARESGKALDELAELLVRHPVLRDDIPDQTWNQQTASWEGPQHLLVPLVSLYAQQSLNQ